MKNIFIAILVFLSSISAFADQSSPTDQNSISFLSSDKEDSKLKEFIVDQINQIEALSLSIYEQEQFDSLESLTLINKRGIHYFFTGQFENGIHDFDYVIDNLSVKSSFHRELLGTALWGRMLCHAFSDQLEKTNEDAFLILNLFHECSSPKHKKEPFLSIKNDYFEVLPVVSFENPNEKISRHECHDRTKNTARIMRSLADLLPTFVVRQAVNLCIDRQEDKSLRCCDIGRHWTECLGPIAEVWKKLEDYLDRLEELFKRGISLERFLTTPNTF